MKILIRYVDGLAVIFIFPESVLMVDVQKAAEIFGQIKTLEFP